jgi:hypothetical protein
MNTGKSLIAKIIVIAAFFALAGRSQAVLCANYLAEIEAAVGIAYATLTNAVATITNDPPLTALEKKQAAAMTRAIRTLTNQPATPAEAYGLFVKAALQLGPLALQGPIGAAGTNLFNAFTNEAQAEIDCTWGRIAALNDFVRTKRAASNQLAQAQRTLDTIPTLTNPQIGILLGRVVFRKIVVANKLAAIGEAHPGFAPNGVIGKTLAHTEGAHSGTVHFDDGVQATETDDEGTRTSAYTYTRTGLNKSTLVLMNPGDVSGTNTTIAKLRFLSNTNGTFTYRFEDSDGETGGGSGRFTID